MIRLVVTGDRNWSDSDLMFNAMATLDLTFTTVIDGEAKGADTLAHWNAERLGMATQRFPAQWEKYGRAAGPIRNQQMLDEGKPTLVWAFHDDLDNSKGTGDMVRRAKKVGLPVVVFSH